MLAIELDDETRTARRTTSRPVVVEANRPHRAGDVNGTLVERGVSNGASLTDLDNEPHDPYEPRPSVKYLLRLRQAADRRPAPGARLRPFESAEWRLVT